MTDTVTIRRELLERVVAYADSPFFSAQLAAELRAALAAHDKQSGGEE